MQEIVKGGPKLVKVDLGMPRFNNGKSTRTEPYKLWKITGLGKSD